MCQQKRAQCLLLDKTLFAVDVTIWHVFIPHIVQNRDVIILSNRILDSIIHVKPKVLSL